MKMKIKKNIIRILSSVTATLLFSGVAFGNDKGLPKDCKIVFPFELESLPAYREAMSTLRLRGFNHDPESQYSVKTNVRQTQLYKSWGSYYTKCEATFFLFKNSPDGQKTTVLALSKKSKYNHGSIIPLPSWGSLGACQEIALEAVLENIPDCQLRD
jgi:hypothetical protein